MNGEILEKLYGYMSDYSDKRGVDASLYASANNDIVRINFTDKTTFVAFNYYLNSDDINNLEDYLDFEKRVDFLDKQQRLYKEDVRSRMGIGETENVLSCKE